MRKNVSGKKKSGKARPSTVHAASEAMQEPLITQGEIDAPRNNRAQGMENKPEKNAKENRANNEGRSYSIASWLESHAAAITAIATTIYAIFALGQWYELNKTYQLTSKQLIYANQALIGISEIIPEALVLEADKLPITFRVNIRNAGQGPAQKLRMRVGIVVAKQEPSDDKYKWFITTREKTILPHRGTTAIVRFEKDEIWPRAFELVNNRDMKLFLKCTCIYYDQFNRECHFEEVQLYDPHFHTWGVGEWVEENATR